MSLGDVCRLCLGTENLLSVFDQRFENEDSVKKTVYITTGVEISTRDTVSQKICDRCCQITIRMFKFRQLSLRNDRSLKAECQQYQNTNNITASNAEVTNENKIIPCAVPEIKKELLLEPEVGGNKIPTAHPSVHALYKNYPQFRIPNICINFNVAPVVSLPMNAVENYFKKRNLDFNLYSSLALKSSNKVARKRTSAIAKSKISTSVHSQNRECEINNDTRLMDFKINRDNSTNRISIKIDNKNNNSCVKNVHSSVINNSKSHIKPNSSSNLKPGKEQIKRKFSEVEETRHQESNKKPAFIKSLGLQPNRSTSSECPAYVAKASDNSTSKINIEMCNKNSNPCVKNLDSSIISNSKSLIKSKTNTDLKTEKAQIQRQFSEVEKTGHIDNNKNPAFIESLGSQLNSSTSSECPAYVAKASDNSTNKISKKNSNSCDKNLDSSITSNSKSHIKSRTSSDLKPEKAQTRKKSSEVEKTRYKKIYKKPAFIESLGSQPNPSTSSECPAYLPNASDESTNKINIKISNKNSNLCDKKLDSSIISNSKSYIRSQTSSDLKPEKAKIQRKSSEVEKTRHKKINKKPASIEFLGPQPNPNTLSECPAYLANTSEDPINKINIKISNKNGNSCDKKLDSSIISNSKSHIKSQTSSDLKPEKAKLQRKSSEVEKTRHTKINKKPAFIESLGTQPNPSTSSECPAYVANASDDSTNKINIKISNKNSNSCDKKLDSSIISNSKSYIKSKTSSDLKPEAQIKTKFSEVEKTRHKESNKKPAFIESLGSQSNPSTSSETSAYVANAPESLHICDICNSVKCTAKDLRKHRNKHLRCEFCKTRFRTLETKKAHVDSSCIIKHTLKGIPDIVVEKIEYNKTIRSKYSNTFADFPPLKNDENDRCENQTSESIEKLTAPTVLAESDQPAIVRDIPHTVEIIEIMSEDEDSPLPPTTSNTDVGCKQNANSSHQSKVHVNTDKDNTLTLSTSPNLNPQTTCSIPQTVIPTQENSLYNTVSVVRPDITVNGNCTTSPNLNQTVPQTTCSMPETVLIPPSVPVQENILYNTVSIVRPDIRINGSCILDNIDLKWSDMKLLKELILNYTSVQLSSSRCTQTDIPSNSSISILDQADFTTELKNLKQELYLYKIPVVVKNGPFNVSYSYNAKEKPPTRKRYFWNTLTPIDIKAKIVDVVVPNTLNEVSVEESEEQSSDKSDKAKIVNVLEPKNLNKEVSVGESEKRSDKDTRTKTNYLVILPSTATYNSSTGTVTLPPNSTAATQSCTSVNSVSQRSILPYTITNNTHPQSHIPVNISTNSSFSNSYALPNTVTMSNFWSNFVPSPTLTTTINSIVLSASNSTAESPLPNDPITVGKIRVKNVWELT